MNLSTIAVLAVLVVVAGGVAGGGGGGGRWGGEGGARAKARAVAAAVVRAPRPAPPYRPHGPPRHIAPHHRPHQPIHTNKYKRHYSLPTRPFPPTNNRYGVGPPRKTRNPGHKLIGNGIKPGYYPKYPHKGGQHIRRPYKPPAPYSSLPDSYEGPKQIGVSLKQLGGGVGLKQVGVGSLKSQGGIKTQPGLKQGEVPSTTYGVPHPTSGSPEPPKDASAPTSYVTFYQGTTSVLGSKSGQESTDGNQQGSYSYKQIHYPTPDKKKRHRTQEAQADESSGGTFQAPKETFGFVPYDSGASKASQTSGYRSSYYQPEQHGSSSGASPSSSSLTPNYYEPDSNKRSSATA